MDFKGCRGKAIKRKITGESRGTPGHLKSPARRAKKEEKSRKTSESEERSGGGLSQEPI